MTLGFFARAMVQVLAAHAVVSTLVSLIVLLTWRRAASGTVTSAPALSRRLFQPPHGAGRGLGGHRLGRHPDRVRPLGTDRQDRARSDRSRWLLPSPAQPWWPPASGA